MIIDDVTYISKRWDEIALDLYASADSGVAEGEYLDYIGGIWGLRRDLGESDYSFRDRLVKNAGGET